jgi:multimeric flavodoxin WrbA
MSVKILGLAGSPRHGNTDIIVRAALEAAGELEGVETEFYSIADANILGGCTGCYRCKKTNYKALCLNPDIRKDDVNDIMKKLLEADGWLVGVPVYFGSIPAQLKCVIDRTMSVEFAGQGYRNKVAGALAVAFDRNGGLERTLADLHSWFMIHDAIPVSVGPERPDEGIACYWGATVLQGYPDPVHSAEWERSLKAAEEDVVGMQQSRFLGRRVAEMTKVVKAGFEHVGETVWPYQGT